MEQINHIAKKKKEYITKINATKGSVEEINQNLNMLDNESFNIQNNAEEIKNEYFKEKVKTNNFFCKTKQLQEATKLIEDYSNKKLKLKSSDAIATETENIQKENEMLMETLRNFKDTHSELSIIIEEVMKI